MGFFPIRDASVFVSRKETKYFPQQKHISHRTKQNATTNEIGHRKKRGSQRNHCNRPKRLKYLALTQRNRNIPWQPIQSNMAFIKYSWYINNTSVSWLSFARVWDTASLFRSLGLSVLGDLIAVVWMVTIRPPICQYCRFLFFYFLFFIFTLWFAGTAKSTLQLVLYFLLTIIRPCF